MGILIRRRGIIAAQPHRATSSGSLVHIDRAEPAPLSCVVGIDAVQSGSGTPSPSNVRPISGWTGANITVSPTASADDGSTVSVAFPALGVNQWDGVWASGEIYSNSGKITPDESSQYFYTVNPIPISDTLTYYIAGEANKPIRPRFYMADGSYIGYTPASGSGYVGNTFVPPTGAAFMRYAPLKTDFPNHQIGINYPSTATAYEPYTNTVYGGTLDTVTGVLTVTHGIIDLGQQAWNIDGNDTYCQLWYIELPSIRKLTNPNALIYGISTIFKSATAREAWYPYYVAFGENYSRNIVYITFDKSAYSTRAQVQAAVSGIPFVYELATPLTYQLPPTAMRTLRGVNNTFADCGSLAATYWTH